STHGIIVLRGDSPETNTVVSIQLTGNCGPDLQGKGFRFIPAENEPEKAIFDPKEHKGFQFQQIGPTGTMTAQGWVRALPCSVEEYVRRAELGEPPPTPWKRSLYLEWYSQNGRIVIELADPTVEECLRPPKGECDEGEWAPLPHTTPYPAPNAHLPKGGPDITVIRNDGDIVHFEHWTPSCQDPEFAENDDSIPNTLQREFDTQAAAIDRAIRSKHNDPDDPDEFMEEMILMDECIENRDGRPLTSFWSDIKNLPRPEQLNDDEVEAVFKGLLARLAMINVALSVCEHYTPRDAYRLLLDEIFQDSSAYEELIGTGWIQHFSTHEYCEACEAEALADFDNEIE
ncbi:MAG TPA: hypothetical protein PLI09_28365, partial [Candidatus Hydrogenedentes bacterium]|nr:hypothetical protein [Candidatus Hydrogenedentota bacterium]